MSLTELGGNLGPERLSIKKYLALLENFWWHNCQSGISISQFPARGKLTVVSRPVVGKLAVTFTASSCKLKPLVERLIDCPWSRYAAYRNKAKAPVWLNRDTGRGRSGL